LTPSLNISNIIPISIESIRTPHRSNKNITELRGFFKGATGSRICSLSVNRTIPNDPTFSIWMYPDTSSQWVLPEGPTLDSSNWTRPDGVSTSTFNKEVLVMKRSFETKDRREIIPFLVRWDAGWRNTSSSVSARNAKKQKVLSLTVNCYLHEELASGVWGDMQMDLPSWVLPTNGRYGGVTITKTIQL
jgi:hypothetical protein